MSGQQKLLVGKIVAAQGLRGEVRVQAYTESPADLRDLAVDAETASLRIKFVRALPNSSIAIMKIDGVGDRTAAEKLRGTQLYADRGALPALADGEYYIADLVGMAVGGRTVAAVHNFGAGDILELDDGEMVSFAGAKVDAEKREIKLKG